VDVAPGREPLIRSLGMCMSCYVGPHDFELWPVCPRTPRGERGSGGEAHNVVTLSEPSHEPGSPSSTGTAGEPRSHLRASRGCECSTLPRCRGSRCHVVRLLPVGVRLLVALACSIRLHFRQSGTADRLD
jgi:hypothetical protein